MADTIQGFGDEWSAFDQSSLDHRELTRMFENYFSLFPFDKDAIGFDLGAGSGRWAKLVAPKVKHLYVIEPSRAIDVAKRNITSPNVTFIQSDVDNMPIPICDFGYSLGVLHHIEDTEGAMQKCVAKLKPKAPFLVYLYYRFDNRPAWFRAVWRITDIFRRIISTLPFSLRYIISQIIAVTVYFPLARMSRVFPFLPLAQYRDNSFYTMRTDALDRFGTRIEHRFTKEEVREMMHRCGLNRIKFGNAPYWTAIGYKR